MSKQKTPAGNPPNGNDDGADDILALAQTQKRDAPKDLAFPAGHNVAVDLRRDDRIVFVVRRGPMWDAANILEVKPGAKSKSKTSTFYLARTQGSLYGSRRITIDGRDVWVKLEISLVKENASE